MTENQRDFWTMSNRIISEYNIVMQDINELTQTTIKNTKIPESEELKQTFKK